MKRSSIGPFLDLTLAMALVGSSVVAGKIITREFPVFLASGLRFGLAMPLLILLLLAREKRLPALVWRDYRVLFLQALTGVFLFSLFLLYGLRYTTSSESGIITSTTPGVTALLAALILGERLNRWKWAGVGLCVAGIAALQLGSGGEGGAEGARGSAHLFGTALILGAVVCEGLFTILGKVMTARLSPLAVSTMVVAFGFMLFLPLAIYEARSFSFSQASMAGWLSIVHYALAVTVLGFVLWYRGVSKVSAATAAVFTGVLPVSALILSYLVLHEELRAAHGLGILLIFGGILCAARER
ncbi:DMT family transporter [Sorangium sp. So ce542]|uniref:DMT family transporter n=1 Tax=Sorangium sp. So ce542 TaxID=3133316 RepID=UPI003F61CA73